MNEEIKVPPMPHWPTLLGKTIDLEIHDKLNDWFIENIVPLNKIKKQTLESDVIQGLLTALDMKMHWQTNEALRAYKKAVRK